MLFSRGPHCVVGSVGFGIRSIAISFAVEVAEVSHVVNSFVVLTFLNATVPGNAGVGAIGTDRQRSSGVLAIVTNVFQTRNVDLKSVIGPVIEHVPWYPGNGMGRVVIGRRN